MAGVTNSAFRRLCRSYGAGLYVSEMVSARALVEGNERTCWRSRSATTRRCAASSSTVSTRTSSGCRPQAVDLGVDHVDLNMGCPSPKVTRHGGGGALPVRAGLCSASSCGGGQSRRHRTRHGQDAQGHRRRDAHLPRRRPAAEAEGVAAVALHARTVEQLYSGRADWSAIGDLKAAVTSVPVFGNGDIWVAEDALA